MAYLLPQEMEVWYIIPAIRKELAKILTKKYDLSHEKAGEILGISKAAVSQYLSKKRANKIKFPKEIKIHLNVSARLLVKNPQQGLREIEKILKKIKEKRVSCDVCKKYNREILNYCQNKPMY